jgi:Cys-tRNA(Pro)/Cys-tRNA(Cys) deacylase
MSKTTRATQALEKLGVKFSLHTYDYDPDADSVGLQAAEALGVAPARMLKTLMAEADGKPVCVVVPSDREVSMKKLAAAFGAKAARMMRPPDAERLTGYHVGGISPFGQKKRARRDRGSCARMRACSSTAGSAACRSSSIPTMR